MLYIIPTDTCFGLACPIDNIKSYEKIYKIKKRDFSNPLAIMVQDFNWLKENTTLSIKQIQFLEDYKKPFTILTDSSSISLWLNYETEDGIGFRNKEIYKNIAIRITHNNWQKKLIKRVGPIFLTSANLSGKKEIYTTKDINTEFSYYIEKKQIKVLAENNFKLPNTKSSDIFKFVGDSLDVKYLRS